jgi:hypothetical protein
MPSVGAVSGSKRDRYLIERRPLRETIDVEGPPLDIRLWGTTEGNVVLLPFSTEDRTRRDHWFVSVAEFGGEDAVIVLCEERDSQRIHAVELFADFIDTFWIHLTHRPDGETLINIERQGGFFYVRIPGADRVRVPVSFPEGYESTWLERPSCRRSDHALGSSRAEQGCSLWGSANRPA